MQQQGRYTLEDLRGVAARLSSMLKNQDTFLASVRDMATAHPWLSSTIQLIAGNYEFNRLEGGSCATAELKAGGGALPQSQMLCLTLPPEDIWFERYPIRWGARVPCAFYFARVAEDTFQLLRSETPEQMHAARVSVAENMEL